MFATSVDRLEHPFIAEAEVAIVTDHDVVEDAHSHDIADFFEAFGDIDVLGARRRIAAWMVVDEDNRRGGFPNDRIVNFTRMNQRRGQRSLGNFYLANLSVLIVQKNDIEKLAPLSAEIFAKVMVHVLRGAKRLAGFPLAVTDAAGNFQARFDLSDFAGPMPLMAESS